MDAAEVEEMASGDTAPDAVYRWTIRLLYATAIALNVWVLWDMMTDEADTAVVKARIRGAWDRITGPIRHEQEVQRSFGKVLWDATQIVEEDTDAP